MGFFLGIDGGGTKTECVLADEAGAVLARAAGRGANLRRISAAELETTLRSCCEQLRRTAGLSKLSVEALGAGFAGAGDPQARRMAEKVLSELLRPRYLYVVGDMEVALEAAVGSGPGVVLIAGTGSIAFGRNAQGQQARAGGRGPEVGDEGSGFDIGRRAAEAVLSTLRGGGPATHLSAAVLEKLKSENAADLERRLWSTTAEALAGLLPVVVAGARTGDPAAKEILEQAAGVLSGLVLTVLQELGLSEAAVQVATSGGVFRESPEVFAAVRDRIRAAAPGAVVEPLAVAPAEGAVRLAQRLWLQERAAATGYKPR